MKISHISGMSDPKQWTDWHVLTVAEAGFSVLDIYGRGRHGLDSDAITRFAEAVNTSNETKSLHPRAPLSAVPQKFFRDHTEVTSETVMDEFSRIISGFIRTNEESIRGSRILVDFHVSPGAVPVRYVQAVEAIFGRCPETSVVQEVVIAA